MTETLLGGMRIRNDEFTAPALIVDQMAEPRPLPLGRAEFEEWSDRIIAGAMIEGSDEEPEALIEGQKYALANMIMHLGPTESHKPDAFFIHSLRKVVINQVAHKVFTELHAKAKARGAARDAEAGNVTSIGAATAP